MHNVTAQKVYQLGQNATLQRLDKNHNCSVCTLTASSTLCDFISKVTLKSDPAFLNRRPNITCPFLVINEEQYNSLRQRNIIDEADSSARRSNNHLVCINNVNFNALEQKEKKYSTEKVIKYACFGISSVGTLGFLVLFCNVPSMQILRRKTVSNLAGSLLMAQLVYMFSIGANENTISCEAAGIALHYLWMCTYAWSVVCAHHMCKVFGKIHKPEVFTALRYSIYMAVGYVIPLLFVAFFVVGEKCSCFPFEISYDKEICFLSSGRMYGLDGPIIATLLANLFYFGIILRYTQTTVITASDKAFGISTSNFVIYVKICTIMGFSWIFGMLARWTSLYPLWIVFTVLNGLQGTFIFLAFVCSRDVVDALRQRRECNAKSVLHRRDTPHRRRQAK